MYILYTYMHMYRTCTYMYMHEHHMYIEYRGLIMQSGIFSNLQRLRYAITVTFLSTSSHCQRATRMKVMQVWEAHGRGSLGSRIEAVGLNTNLDRLCHLQTQLR